MLTQGSSWYTAVTVAFTCWDPAWTGTDDGVPNKALKLDVFSGTDEGAESLSEHSAPRRSPAAVAIALASVAA